MVTMNKGHILLHFQTDLVPETVASNEEALTVGEPGIEAASRSIRRKLATQTMTKVERESPDTDASGSHGKVFCLE